MEYYKGIIVGGLFALFIIPIGNLFLDFLNLCASVFQIKAQEMVNEMAQQSPQSETNLIGFNINESEYYDDDFEEEHMDIMCKGYTNE